jgi:phosphonate transport system substrate-binding protein
MNNTTPTPLPNRNRRQWLLQAGGLAAAGLIGLPRKAGATGKKIRVGMTPAFLHDQHSLLGEWRDFMAESLKRPVEFVQRDSYRETMDLLRLDKLEFAWVCDYPYLHLKDTVRLLAVPLYQGRPHYRSYLIVHKDAAGIRSMADLQDSVFAYADPYSNTGYLAPRYEIRQLGRDPRVSSARPSSPGRTARWSKPWPAGWRAAARWTAISGRPWPIVEPALVKRTRLVSRSPEYGFPPFVAHRSVAAPEFRQMQEHLLGTGGSEAGRRLLARLYLDGFTAGTPALYDGVAQMMRAFGEA